MTDTLTPTLDYKVADITLAEFGRKEISIAEFFEKNKQILGFDSQTKKLYKRTFE